LQAAVNALVSHVVNNGIRHVIICPGSRNAPLTLSFSRHPDIQCYSLVDERSAAFTAIGIAVALHQAVAIVCTSGTAVLNLYPAICEAYYSQIPLLIITADRPSELIDQWDGQAIRQTNIFDKHILGSYTYDPLNPPVNIEEAVQLCLYPKKGPVHINVPLKEPLYEAKNQVFQYDTFKSNISLRSLQESKLPSGLPYKKIVLFAGADAYGIRLNKNFKQLVEANKVVVISDIISGLTFFQTTKYWDTLTTLAQPDLKQTLKPELLITVGKFTVSKGFKNFIKAYKPKEHWHITANHTIADPFETNPIEIISDEKIFLGWLSESAENLNSEYCDTWINASKNTKTKFENLFVNPSFNEFSAVNEILNYLPNNCYIHIGNSMSVRIVSFLAGKLKQQKVYGNRGTSGIDGSTSTSAGTSMLVEEPVFLLTGDLSFFYDINGLWNSYLKPNFKIIVINNSGGGIFRLIDGPNDLPERETYFSTHSKRDAKRLAEEFGFEYFKARDFVSLQAEIIEFINNTAKPCILEVFVDSEKTIDCYTQFKNIKIDTRFSDL